MTKLPSLTWNLTPLFPSDHDSEIAQERQRVEKEAFHFRQKWEPRSDYLSDPAVLKAALDDYESWARHTGTGGAEWYYFFLRNCQDQVDPLLRGRLTNAQEAASKITNLMEFFTHRVAKITAQERAKFLHHPSLQQYKHWLERLFAEADFLLSEAEEKIMNLKSQPAHDHWVRMTETLLSSEQRLASNDQGQRARLPFSRITSLLNHPKKEIRDGAARAFNSILARYVDVAEHETNAILLDKKINDELRGFKRPDQARLLADDIDSTVVDQLVATVKDRFDLSCRYYTLKAKLLGVPKLAYHERNVEYGQIDRKYSFTEGVGIVQKVLQRLHPRFGAIFQNFLDHGQIDVYPRKGKRSGAFCDYNLITQPVYILLNYTDRLNDVLTLAHELGHGINDELVRIAQNALNFGTPTCTAEIASTFIEDFVLTELLEEASHEDRLTLLMMKLNEDISTIFRQIACYRFETELHQQFRIKGYLSKKEIGESFQKHMAAYMGPSVEQSPGSQNWWVYWSHIRSYFYVYSYAFGLLISKYFQQKMRADPNDIKQVITFLSVGLSLSPNDNLRQLNIDITQNELWVTGIAEIERTLVQAETLAKKLRKIN